MIKTRNIAWEIQIRKERMQKFIDFIHITSNYYYEGCPRLILYGFLKEEGLSTKWLHETLLYLKKQHILLEPIKDHYEIATYGPIHIL